MGVRHVWLNANSLDQIPLRFNARNMFAEFSEAFKLDFSPSSTRKTELLFRHEYVVFLFHVTSGHQPPLEVDVCNSLVCTA